MKREPLTAWEKQMRDALREAIAVVGNGRHRYCLGCGADRESVDPHNPTCIVTTMRRALRRPKRGG